MKADKERVEIETHKTAILVANTGVDNTNKGRVNKGTRNEK